MSTYATPQIPHPTATLVHTRVCHLRCAAGLCQRPSPAGLISQLARHVQRAQCLSGMYQDAVLFAHFPPQTLRSIDFLHVETQIEALTQKDQPPQPGAPRGAYP